MTTSKRSDEEKSELYARALMEAAQAQGRSNKDLVQWRHAVKFSPEVLEVLAAMHTDDELGLLKDVEVAYKELLDSDDETAFVTATTAVEMDDELRANVHKKLEDMLGRPIYLVERIDPSIVGGIIVEVAGNRYDASVKAQLEHIREDLSAAYMGSDDDD
jgi:F-type H+-transporting ATPase subunit delta